MAHRLPVLIHSVGLAQAVAFVEARGDDYQKRLLQDLAHVVNEPELAKSSCETGMAEYLLLTQRCLEALSWFKRYTQLILSVEADE